MTRSECTVSSGGEQLYQEFFGTGLGWDEARDEPLRRTDFPALVERFRNLKPLDAALLMGRLLVAYEEFDREIYLSKDIETLLDAIERERSV